jgi:uncharacterized protein (TIGR00369 family)
MDTVTKGNPRHALDADGFFQDQEFSRKYPGVNVPPPCFKASGARIIAHEQNRSLTVEFPVREDHANPLGGLQGGVLCSFFDNVFGPLSFVTMRKPCVSLDMSVHFVRPAHVGETLTIRAEFKARGKQLLLMYAEARNEKQKLVATATSNLTVFEP